MSVRCELTWRMQLLGLLLCAALLPLILTFCVWRIIIKGWGRFVGAEARRERPDVLDGQEYGEHCFIRCKSGLRLHCVVSGQEDAPLLLLLHGFPLSWYSWRHQITHFSHSYRVAAVDLRGCGESDKPRGVQHYTLNSLTEDVSDTITALGYSRCVLIGHDWGAVVAAATSCVFPHQVERLVLVSAPPLSVLYSEIKNSWSQALRSLFLYFLSLPWLPELVVQSEDLRWLKTALVGYFIGARRGTYSRQDMDAVKYYMAQKDTLSGALSHFRAAWTRRHISSLPTTHIYAPTLMVWGTSDFLYPPHLATVAKNTITVNARIHLVQGGSHWLMEEYPGKVNRVVEEFLQDEDSNLYMDDNFIPAKRGSSTKSSKSASRDHQPVSVRSHSLCHTGQNMDELQRFALTEADRDSSLHQQKVEASSRVSGRRRSSLWGIKSSHALLDLLAESDASEEEQEPGLLEEQELLAGGGGQIVFRQESSDEEEEEEGELFSHQDVLLHDKDITDGRKAGQDLFSHEDVLPPHDKDITDGRKAMGKQAEDLFSGDDDVREGDGMEEQEDLFPPNEDIKDANQDLFPGDDDIVGQQEDEYADDGLEEVAVRHYVLRQRSMQTVFMSDMSDSEAGSLYSVSPGKPGELQLAESL